VWDAETGTVLAILTGHSEAILQAAWNADESRILTASGDGTARQWYAQMDDLIAAACEQGPRNMTPAEGDGSSEMSHTGAHARVCRPARSETPRSNRWRKTPPS
jgi:WD40 repeat protein